MTFIDSHTHLFDTAFDTDREAMVSRALTAGVTRMYLPNIDLDTTKNLLTMTEKWPEVCFPMLGLHPCAVKEDYRQQIEQLREMAEMHPVKAIGEIGLDFYWDVTFKAEQIIAFEQQIDWALESDLPIVIHTRNSIPEGIELVQKKQNGRLKGVFHCFTGTIEQANQIIESGFYIGIGGVATFKNGGLEPLLKELDLSHILLETDAPYLAPVPYRGKRNESSYIPIIAEKIAAIKEVAVEQVAVQTTQNALNLFEKK